MNISYPFLFAVSYEDDKKFVKKRIHGLHVIVLMINGPWIEMFAVLIALHNNS